MRKYTLAQTVIRAWRRANPSISTNLSTINSNLEDYDFKIYVYMSIAMPINKERNKGAHL